MRPPAIWSAAFLSSCSFRTTSCRRRLRPRSNIAPTWRRILRTPDADPDIPRSELLNPTAFSANPIASAPVAAKITGSGAQLADVIADVTGTGTFAVPATTQLGAGNGGTLRITVTPSGGVATNYDIALADTATLNSIVAAINGTAGLGAAGAVEASIDTTGGTNKLRLEANSADYDFEINPFSTDALTTRLGLAEVAGG